MDLTGALTSEIILLAPSPHPLPRRGEDAKFTKTETMLESERWGSAKKLDRAMRHTYNLYKRFWSGRVRVQAQDDSSKIGTSSIKVLNPLP